MDKEAAKLKAEISSALSQLKVAELDAKLKLLSEESRRPDFWTRDDAPIKMKELARLKTRVKPWLELAQSSEELSELSSLDDPKLEAELRLNLEKLKSRFSELKQQLMFNGEYDDHGAVLALFAGAGGTDAQDWTQMLFRMYIRYFDRNGWKYTVIDESPGEEAGLKSAVLEIDNGDFIYGMLKGEQGVHRLVRLSPFNADNLRQTSFAKVEVYPKIDSPDEVEVDEKDLKIDVYRSGGHGGQSVNTTDSAVRLTHIPTGINVAIQNERSQQQNRETAMRILRSRLAQLSLEQHANKLSELKGPSQSAEWGNQIRSYVLHPYKQVKDLRTGQVSNDPDKILGGELEPFIKANLEHSIGPDPS